MYVWPWELDQTVCEYSFFFSVGILITDLKFQNEANQSFMYVRINLYSLFIFTRKQVLGFYKFIYFLFIFMAVLGLHFCVRAFSSRGKRGPLFIAVRGPLTIAASLVAEHRLQTRRLSNCGSRAQVLRGMWDLPRPGLEPVSPALAGRFSTDRKSVV